MKRASSHWKKEFSSQFLCRVLTIISLPKKSQSHYLQYELQRYFQDCWNLKIKQDIVTTVNIRKIVFVYVERFTIWELASTVGNFRKNFVIQYYIFLERSSLTLLKKSCWYFEELFAYTDQVKTMNLNDLQL